MMGWMSWGYCSGSYSRSASWTRTICAGRLAKPRAQGGPFSLVELVSHELQVAVALRHLTEDLARAVGRAVVDDDDFLANRDGAHPTEDLANGLLFVIGWDDDRKRQVSGDPVDSQLAAERLTQSVDEPVPALNVVRELRDRGAGTRNGGAIGRGGLRLGGKRVDVHRARVLGSSARPNSRLVVAPGLDGAWDGAAGMDAAKIVWDQDKRRPHPREARSPERRGVVAVVKNSWRNPATRTRRGRECGGNDNGPPRSRSGPWSDVRRSTGRGELAGRPRLIPSG